MLNREDTTITGVLNVDRFDDYIIVVDTELGTLVLRGQGLHIQQLDLDEGTFKVEGLVTVLEYTGGSRRREGGQSLLERLFR
jgi:sporulation protein YabP